MRRVSNSLITMAWVLLCLSFVKAAPLSDRAQISILTCGPGTDLYALFGHSAIRIVDRANELDVVYNYGTFDFEAPNFALNFLRGKLTFWVAPAGYDRFLTEYYYTQRTVREQVLALTVDEKQAIYDYLLWNVQPANRTYQYDFYFDNCTTRIRDLIEDKSSLRYGATGVSKKTFRNLLHEYLISYPWTQFGMDLILGTLSDAKTTVSEQMFLPEYYYHHLEGAEVSSNGQFTPLVSEDLRILEFPLTAVTRSSFFTPTVVFWTLFGMEVIIFFLYYIAGHTSRLKWHDKTWFVVLFGVFLVLLGMWVFTDHVVCRANWNILWTCPWMICWVFSPPDSALRRCFLWLSAAVLIGMLLFWKLIPQQIHPAVVPIILISAFKVFRQLGVILWIDRLRNVPVTAAFILVLIPIQAQEKIAGISLVGTPAAYEFDPMPPVVEVNANWVALIPFAFSRVAQPEVRWGSERQWWGERTEGIVENVRLAKKYGMKVMIKPQVWIPRGWVGEMDFEQETDWVAWEKDYREYILHYADLAAKLGVEMFCVGTEFRLAVRKREAYWRALIDEIRTRYQGQLVYSANWDSFEEVPIWDALDFIGISAYFPLTTIATPPEFVLNIKWKKIKRKLRSYSDKIGKRILFTEFGYLSVDGAAGKTWELEDKVRTLKINEQAQANAYGALLSNFVFEDFWAGGFLWKWFPNGFGHEGYPERDYTPQGKISEQTIASWYQRAVDRR